LPGAARLAGVVHEQGEEEQIEAINFREQTGEPLFPTHAAAGAGRWTLSMTWKVCSSTGVKHAVPGIAG